VNSSSEDSSSESNLKESQESLVS